VIDLYLVDFWRRTGRLPIRREVGMRFSHNAAEPVEELADGFSEFWWQEIARNRITIGLEIDRLWNKLMKEQLPPSILTGSDPKAHSEKLRVMKDKYKIDERAIGYFDLVDAVTKDTPRSVSVLAFNRSEALKAYLSNLSPTFWQTLLTTLILTDPTPRGPMTEPGSVPYGCALLSLSFVAA